MVGLEEGSLPHAHAIDKPEQVEEERRLAYVGFTRAMRRLYLVSAMRRSSSGEHRDTEPSRFLNDIPADLMVPNQVGISRGPGALDASKAGGALWVPSPISDREQDVTGKREKEEARCPNTQ